jgi:hypothetical protein
MAKAKPAVARASAEQQQNGEHAAAEAPAAPNGVANGGVSLGAFLAGERLWRSCMAVNALPCLTVAAHLQGPLKGPLHVGPLGSIPSDGPMVR